MLIIAIILLSLLLMLILTLRTKKHAAPHIVATYLSGNELILHYSDLSHTRYYYDHGQWRKQPGMKKVDIKTQNTLNEIVAQAHPKHRWGGVGQSV